MNGLMLKEELNKKLIGKLNQWYMDQIILNVNTSQKKLPRKIKSMKQ